MTPTFSYGVAKLRDLRIEEEPQERQERHVEVGGTTALSTSRFWSSLARRYNFSQKMFRYFSPPEVLDRVAKAVPDDRVRYCLEHRKHKPSRLLAVSNPDRPIVEHDAILDVMRHHDGSQLAYLNGVISSTHQPPIILPTNIGGDGFERRLHFESPIDGYGQPKIYVAFVRLICRNGQVAYCRAFRTGIALGEDPCHSIKRALLAFNDDEGYGALHQRFESSQTSWASVRECLSVHRALEATKVKKGVRKKRVLEDFQRTTGDLNDLYGMADLAAISVKRQRLLPSKARVYDLLNFTSEVATHHTRPSCRRMLNATIGDLVSDEFDLEGTAEVATEFTDLFISDTEVGPRPSIN